MKVVGLIFAASSFILFAAIKLRAYRDRIMTVQEVLDFLQRIKQELSSMPAPMQDMFLNIAEKNPNGKNIFLKLAEDMNLLGEKCFYDIWKENIIAFFPQLSIDEKHEIISLGAGLGFSSTQMQIKLIENCEELLSETVREEKNAYPKIHKLYIGLSAAAAAALIIVFI